MKQNFIDNLLSLTNIEVAMNHDQFQLWKNDEITLTEIKVLNKLDTEIGNLNSTAYDCLVFALATVIGCINTYASTLTTPCFGIEGIDTIGNTFLGIFRKVGYWAALIMAFVEIIKVIIKGGNSTSEIWQIVFKYVLIYATMFLVPLLFDMVTSAF